MRIISLGHTPVGVGVDVAVGVGVGVRVGVLVAEGDGVGAAMPLRDTSGRYTGRESSAAGTTPGAVKHSASRALEIASL
jgi:hypothetical protein